MRWAAQQAGRLRSLGPRDMLYTHPTASRQLFRAFAAEEIDHTNIARGALLIALEEYPQLHVDEYLARLDALADRVNAKCTTGEPAIFTLGHLQSELFDTEGFNGDLEHYYDPRNSMLNEVMDRRVGIPISLSIVTMHVAHRVGLDVAGVGLPGHYVVKVRFDLSEVYIDPFNGGAHMTVQELDQFIQSHSQGRVRLQPEHLRSWDGRQTLMRVLLNLQNAWTRLGETRKAVAAHERLEILQLPQEN